MAQAFVTNYQYYMKWHKIEKVEMYVNVMLG